MIRKLVQNLALALAVTGFVGMQTVEAAEAEEPKVIGLMFYSDSCGSCKTLDPKVKTASKDYAEQPILFVTFDHSNDTTKNQSALLASALDMEKVYGAQKKASGFLLLVDPKSGEVISKLTKTMSEDDIKAEFDKALKS